MRRHIMLRMNEDGGRNLTCDIGTYAQVAITVILLGFLAHLIYVGVTEEAMRIWIAAMHWGKRLERVMGALVVSAVASFGLTRSWRWAWWVAFSLDFVVVVRCVYEIGWAEWDLYANGRLFDNSQDIAFALIFFAALACLSVSGVMRYSREQQQAAFAAKR